MFTGIIEEIGSVCRVSSGRISGEIAIKAAKVLEGTRIGDSIAVNGVCLTVTKLMADGFAADVMAETLRRSNLGQLKIGDKVDLERAMAAGGRLGGHIVSGHIDGVGRIVERREEGNAVWVRVQAPKEILRLIVEKGSVAVDGISLTVASVTDRDFQVSIIPHTGSETVLLAKRLGDKVNLENDVVGKYVEKLLNYGQVPQPQASPASPHPTQPKTSTSQTSQQQTPQPQPTLTQRQASPMQNGISLEFLMENGF